jgi:hypothetical protein
MRFLRRHQYLLCFLSVLVFACVMVLRQFMANQTAHVELREDFLLLHERGDAKACDALYEQLIRSLARLDEKSLVDDLQRTMPLVEGKTPDKANPVWKYYVSVKNELRKRSEKRLARILAGSGEQ